MLVVVSLRGAADGLSLVVPHADPVYYAGAPGHRRIAADQLLARDGMFGLHPSLAPLLPLWQSGRLAAVHATGLPAANRSHFSAMEEIEDASAGSSTRVGWLNRLIGLDALTSPVQGIGLGSGVVPTSLAGPSPAMAASSPRRLTIPGEEDGHAAAAPRQPQDPVGLGQVRARATAARDTFAAVDTLAPVVAGSATPAGGATYPRGDLGEALAHAARIIRGDVGVQVITVDQGDWDMHTGVGTLEWGRLKDNAATFASALAAFFTDIGSLRRQGDRRVPERVRPPGRGERQLRPRPRPRQRHVPGRRRRVRAVATTARWPGLDATAADADLTVTTDYRSVLAEVVRTRFGADSSRVFPGFVGPSLGTMA